MLFKNYLYNIEIWKRNLREYLKPYNYLNNIFKIVTLIDDYLQRITINYLKP